MLQPNSRYIYLDSAASTLDMTDVSPAMPPGNPNSIHKLGLMSTAFIRDVEKNLLDHINGHDGKIIWTGSGSAANNLAMNEPAHKGISIVLATEHKSITQWSDHRTRVIPVNEYGVAKLESIKWGGAWPRIISMQMVNNETGCIQPVKALCNLRDDKDPLAFVHTDAVQAMGKLLIDVEDLGVDMLTFSAHKINGPKGLGGLWVRNRVFERKAFPYLGTPPTDLIYRFGQVLGMINIQKDANKIALLEDAFLIEMKKQKVEFERTSTGERLTGILSLCFNGVDADELAMELSDQRVYISTGSACTSNKVSASHVLLAMGRTIEQANSTIRVSIGHEVTKDDCVLGAQIIASTVKELRNGS